jgi:pimeloyl-ACP methyl ester carboxylesterase
LTLRSGLPDVRGRRVRFDAMVRYDLPIGVAKVLEKTAYPELDYVGFSMGGMLLYAAVDNTVPKRAIRRAVIVGSPGYIRLPKLVRAIATHLPRSLIPGSHFKLLARIIAFMSEWFTTPFHGIAMNPRNVASGITRAILVNVIEDVPAALNADFVEMAKHGGALTAFGEPVLERLRTVSIPALFVAGSKDNIAPMKSVRAAFDAWAGAHPEVEKRFFVLGRDHGHGEDYGHGDLALGVHVGVELFGDIAAFLGDDVAQAS